MLMGKFLVFEKVGEEIQVHNQKGDFLGYLILILIGRSHALI